MGRHHLYNNQKIGLTCVIFHCLVRNKNNNNGCRFQVRHQRSLSSLLLSDSESCKSSFSICGIEAAAAAVEDEVFLVDGGEVAVIGIRRSEIGTCVCFEIKSRIIVPVIDS